MSKDPVCGMEVEDVKAAGTIDYHGRTLQFCSEGCFERFLKEDSRFPKNLTYELIIIGGVRSHNEVVCLSCHEGSWRTGG